MAQTDQGRRTFRVDRIAEVVVTDTPVERPVGFELAAEWERIVGEVELHRSQLTATVVIEAKFVPVLRDQFGRRHCEVQERLHEGRVRVRVAAPTALMIAEHLAGWGALIEVIEPPSVQAELARIGAELTARYAP